MRSLSEKLVKLSTTLNDIGLVDQSDAVKSLIRAASYGLREYNIYNINFNNLRDVLNTLHTVSNFILESRKSVSSGSLDTIKLILEALIAPAYYEGQERESGNLISHDDSSVAPFSLSDRQASMNENAIKVVEKSLKYLIENKDWYKDNILKIPHVEVISERSGGVRREPVSMLGEYNEAILNLETLIEQMKEMDREHKAAASPGHVKSLPNIEQEEYRPDLIPAKYEVGQKVKVYASNPYKYFLVGSDYEKGAKGEVESVQLRNNAPAEYSVLFYFREADGGDQLDFGIMEEDIRPIE